MPLATCHATSSTHCSATEQRAYRIALHAKRAKLDVNLAWRERLHVKLEQKIRRIGPWSFEELSTFTPFNIIDVRIVGVSTSFNLTAERFL